MYQNTANQIEFPKVRGKSKDEAPPQLKISRIKAGAYDSAAFDDKHQKMFTWGQFGNMRMDRRG